MLDTRNDGSAIEIVEVDLKPARTLVRAQDLFPDAGLSDARFSPDGEHVAFVKRPTRPRHDGLLQEEVWVMNADGESPRKLADGSYPSWGADPNLLYIKDGRRHFLQSIRLDVPGDSPRDAYLFSPSRKSRMSPFRCAGLFG